MPVRDRLNDDLKTAMRAKDSVRLMVIRSVKAAILQAETKNQRTTLEEDGILQVLAKEVKERRDAIVEFERAGRPELVAKLHEEIAVLAEYLPEPLSPEELSSLIEEAIRTVQAQSPKDMGRVMGWLSPRTRGRAEGKAVSEEVRRALQDRAN